MPLEILIIGGSTAGLLHGIMAKRLGHSVRILEQQTSSLRDGQAAGISTGSITQEFLEQYDRCTSPYYVPASHLSVRDASFKQTIMRPTRFRMTSRNTLYYRLRTNFDGLRSEYNPKTPDSEPGDGHAIYEIGKKVTEVSERDGCVAVVVEDVINGGSQTLFGDRVIAADGANSTVRQLLLPNVERKYAGYLTWRASIPESKLKKETVEAFEDKSVVYDAGGNYAVVYFIPGDLGAVSSGNRHLNFVWYFNCASPAEFQSVMTDTSGHTHSFTVPPGKIRPEIWEKQKRLGKEVLAPVFHDVLDNVEVPFITAISDYRCPQASFFNGKLFLVGDALALFRPHNAQSTAQAAAHAIGLKAVLDGTMDWRKWEQEALVHANVTGWASITIGAWYLQSRMWWLYCETRSRMAQWGRRWGKIM